MGLLENKIMLITGGTGAIGSALVQEVLREGADVAFTWSRKAEEAARLEALAVEQGRRCYHAQVEGRDPEAVEAFVEEVERRFGRIDILVNNLGAIQIMPFALIDADDWDQVIGINLKSMFLFTKSAVRDMICRRAGVIINMGSIAGARMLEVPVHYATAKAGVVGFTVSLAKELARYNIRVNAIAPGLIEGGIGFSVTPQQLEEYKRFCGAGRPGKPEEVASLVAFLASDKAAYINAQNLVVDGGL